MQRTQIHNPRQWPSRIPLARIGRPAVTAQARHHEQSPPAASRRREGLSLLIDWSATTRPQQGSERHKFCRFPTLASHKALMPSQSVESCLARDSQRNSLIAVPADRGESGLCGEWPSQEEHRCAQPPICCICMRAKVPMGGWNGLALSSLHPAFFGGRCFLGLGRMQ
jgi:hypothetical protein